MHEKFVWIFDEKKKISFFSNEDDDKNGKKLNLLKFDFLKIFPWECGFRFKKKKYLNRVQQCDFFERKVQKKSKWLKKSEKFSFEIEEDFALKIKNVGLSSSQKFLILQPYLDKFFPSENTPSFRNLYKI